MAIAEIDTGSETVSTTEWSMTTDSSGPDADTTDGVFQAFVDVSAIANGDVFQFRVYEKDTSSGTQRVVFETVFAHAQLQPLFVTPALLLMHGWDMTLKKISGTDRAITWSIRQVS